MTDLEMFHSLFQGRTDAYGTWEGGSVRSAVTIETFANHINGKELIGIYPLSLGNTVKWGCSDIDVDDIDSARNLQTALKVKGIPSFVEKTRKGFHVWVFANDWVSGAIMRRAFLSAHEAIGLPAREVNPKQEETTGLGNYVRLPYPNGLNVIPENRYVLFEESDESAMTLHQFLITAMDMRVPANKLLPLAEMHRPRNKAHLESLDVSTSVQEALDHVDAYVATIWRNGPLPGSDRSNTLVRMVHYMHNKAVPINFAYVILVDADKRWGKFHLRHDVVEQLTKIVEDVYSTEVTGAFRP